MTVSITLTTFTLLVDPLTNRSCCIITINNQPQILLGLWQIVMMPFTFLNTGSYNLCTRKHLTYTLRFCLSNRNQNIQSFTINLAKELFFPFFFFKSLLKTPQNRGISRNSQMLSIKKHPFFCKFLDNMT